MQDLTHWDYAEDFTKIEVAYLIMGVDPSKVDKESISARHIVRKIDEAYKFAIERAKVDVFFMKVSDDVYEIEMQNLTPIQKCLSSTKMDRLYKSLKDDDSYFASWLEHGEYFLDVKFSRTEVARWIKENSLNSIYKFEGSALEVSEKNEKGFSTRERNNMLNIIGALLGMLETKEGALIAELLEKYPPTPGIKKRTLEEKFAEAKRSLRNT